LSATISQYFIGDTMSERKQTAAAGRGTRALAIIALVISAAALSETIYRDFFYVKQELKLSFVPDSSYIPTETKGSRLKTARPITQLFAVIRENEIVSARERFNLPVDY
jgi:hypothetical protein